MLTFENYVVPAVLVQRISQLEDEQLVLYVCVHIYICLYEYISQLEDEQLVLYVCVYIYMFI